MDGSENEYSSSSRSAYDSEYAESEAGGGTGPDASEESRESYSDRSSEASADVEGPVDVEGLENVDVKSPESPKEIKSPETPKDVERAGPEDVASPENMGSVQQPASPAPSTPSAAEEQVFSSRTSEAPVSECTPRESVNICAELASTEPNVDTQIESESAAEIEQPAETNERSPPLSEPHTPPDAAERETAADDPTCTLSTLNLSAELPTATELASPPLDRDLIPKTTMERKRRVDAQLRRIFAAETPLKTGPIRVWKKEAKLLSKVNEQAKVTVSKMQKLSMQRSSERAVVRNKPRSESTAGYNKLLTSLDAGYKLRKKEALVKPYIVEAKQKKHITSAVFGHSDRHPLQWPNMTSESPGPIYNVQMPWSSDVVKQYPRHAPLKNMPHNMPGPGEYQVQKADRLVRSKPVHGVFMGSEKIGERGTERRTAGTHLGWCYPPLKKIHARESKSQNLKKFADKLSLVTNKNFDAGVRYGDVYCEYPHAAELLPQDEKLLKSWEVKCTGGDGVIPSHFPDHNIALPRSALGQDESLLFKSLPGHGTSFRTPELKPLQRDA
eukprot:TRINITY_DN15936_c0_g1_i1.p1 TRINITY_DN15936_c0_g1~~TRINITY_DN15936_c0_g1_i1.p1  ORF type:complete len:558 (+),score=107.63 TRINITY_DN15936_c0_g1_i1:588-2261(+)